MRQTQRRMSIRNVAMTYGIPARTVTRAVNLGELPAVKTTTETGRQRVYVSYEDAERWFNSLVAEIETNEVQREKVMA